MLPAYQKRTFSDFQKSLSAATQVKFLAILVKLYSDLVLTFILQLDTSGVSQAQIFQIEVSLTFQIIK